MRCLSNRAPFDITCIGEPQKPQLVRDLGFSIEDPEANHRRCEWIRHYVRENDLASAYDLGWDGKPFSLKTYGELVDEALHKWEQLYASQSTQSAWDRLEFAVRTAND